MTTPADVRSAWKRALWDVDAAVRAISTVAYDHEISDAESQAEAGRFRDKTDQSRINFFTYIVTRQQTIGLSGQVQYTILVSVNYYLDDIVNGKAYNSVVDALVVVDTRVRPALGRRWNDTVDYWTPRPAGAIELARIELDGLPVWRGQYEYVGVRKTVI